MRFDQETERKIISLLRFGSTRPDSLLYRCLTYRAIAMYMGRSVTYIREVCMSIKDQHAEMMAKYRVLTRSRNHGDGTD